MQAALSDYTIFFNFIASSKAEDDEASLYQNVETDADLETESASEKEIAAGQQV